MITKQQILDDCRHETNVIKHLATKVPAGKLDWRPTPGQRSVLELMQYITAAAQMGAVYCVTGNWEHAPGLSQASQAVTADSFAGAMDRQMEAIESTLADIDETAAATEPAEMPWKETTTQSRAFLQTVSKQLTAYRMQFFLYAKQAGNADLNTFNCWVGQDAPGA